MVRFSHTVQADSNYGSNQVCVQHQHDQRPSADDAGADNACAW